MEFPRFLALILCGILGSTVASTIKQESEHSAEDSDIDLRQKLREMETRLSLLESKNGPLKAQEDHAGTHREEILWKVTDVEKRCMESTAELQGKLQNAENRLLKVDNHLLLEVHEAQKKSSEAFEKVQHMELELTSMLKNDQKEIENLQVKQNETRDIVDSFLTSQRDIKDIIRKNLSSTAEELRAYIDDRFTRLENIQSNLTVRIRAFENSLLKLEKDCASRGVQTQNDISRNLDKTELQEADSQWRCSGEPPSLRNGKVLKFERSLGSTVQYECDRDFVMTRNSTVRCELGKWEGQPPTCAFFDATFVLECHPLAPDYFKCYSDGNYGKIKLSRALDTGRGAGLTENSNEHLDDGKYTFSFTDDDYPERFGAFKCELKAEHGYMNIVAVIQRSKYIADMVSLDPFRVANIGDSVKLEVDLRRKLSVPIKWKHNGVDIPSWDGQVQVEIQNVQTADAGIYECFYLRRRNEGGHALIRLTVRNCKENYYGENCDQKCPPCYNGGICHDRLGICVCPAGFTGSSCEVACDGSHFGVNCSKECYSVECGFRYFCKPDPYGCSCPPGHTGFDCRKECDAGWYGANCKQPCHCASGPESCNIFNGVCTGGCSPGWTGQSCQIPEDTQQVYDHDDLESEEDYS